jgi:hypothetical protein
MPGAIDISTTVRSISRRAATQPLTTLGEYNKSICCVFRDGCEHREIASMHLATVKHHGRIKTQQCSRCLYLICETTKNVRERRATPLIAPLSTLDNNRKFVFIPKFIISSDGFCQVT